MKNKCDMNLVMAHRLSQDSQQEGWTTSVHCSYYAVLQWMKYLLAEKAADPVTYDEQNAHSGESSHQYILTEIRNRIVGKNEERGIKNRIDKLRLQRVLADYRMKVFTQAEALECENEAVEIIKHLRKLLSA